MLISKKVRNLINNKLPITDESDDFFNAKISIAENYLVKKQLYEDKNMLFQKRYHPIVMFYSK